MGSLAADHIGNIALGYSVSSATVYPSIRYAGRLTTDPLGQRDTTPPAKPAALSPAETEQWLQEFGELDSDPELKKFNRPFEDFRDPD